MYSVKAENNSDLNRPPNYRVVPESEVVVLPRQSRSDNPELLFHLSPGTVDDFYGHSTNDDTLPLDSVFTETLDLTETAVRQLTPSSADSFSSSDGEFLQRLNAEYTPIQFSSVPKRLNSLLNTAEVIVDGVPVSAADRTQHVTIYTDDSADSAVLIGPTVTGPSHNVLNLPASDDVPGLSTAVTTASTTGNIVPTGSVVADSGIVEVTNHDSDTDSDTNMAENPPNFGGTANDYAEQWLRHFENCCDFKQYNADRKMAYFRVLLTGSAATWYDSLSGEPVANWNNLKAAFKARYLTPGFMKFKSANDLFNSKQGSATIDDFVADMQRLGRQVGAPEDMLRYAILNGLRQDIRQYVTSQQPTDLNALLEAARVAEMCFPTQSTDPNAALTAQLNVMQEQLSKLTAKMDTPTVSAVTQRDELRSSRPSSTSPKRVHFEDERRSRRDDRRDTRDRRDRGRSFSPYGRDDSPYRRYESPTRQYDNYYTRTDSRRRPRDGYSRGPFRAGGRYSAGGRGDGRPSRTFNRGGQRAGGQTPPPCICCGSWRHLNFNDCPAVNQLCNGCGRKGHFIRVCRSRGETQMNYE